MNMMGYQQVDNGWEWTGKVVTDEQIAECEEEIALAKSYLADTYNLNPDDPVGDHRTNRMSLPGNRYRDSLITHLATAEEQLRTLKNVHQAWMVNGIINHARAAQGYEYEYE